MSSYTIPADIRVATGKGAARRLREKGKIPAILYGSKTDPIMLEVDSVLLERMIRQGAGESSLIDINVRSENKESTHTVILKELQVDPVKQFFRHADFHEISMDKEITLEITLELVNTPAGVEQGGILETIRRSLTVSCLPGNLVDRIQVDVSGMDIGDTLHVKDVDLPPGLTVQDDGDLAVVTISAPSEETEPEEPSDEEELPETEDESQEA